jgi:hypothetical protein
MTAVGGGSLSARHGPAEIADPLLSCRRQGTPMHGDQLDDVRRWCEASGTSRPRRASQMSQRDSRVPLPNGWHLAPDLAPLAPVTVCMLPRVGLRLPGLLEVTLRGKDLLNPITLPGVCSSPWANMGSPPGSGVMASNVWRLPVRVYSLITIRFRSLSFSWSRLKPQNGMPLTGAPWASC